LLLLRLVAGSSLDFFEVSDQPYSAEMALRHLSTIMAEPRYDRIPHILGLVLTVLALVGLQPAIAQETSRDAWDSQASPQTNQSDPVGLPSWAEPDARASESGTMPQDDGMQTDDTPPPPPIDQVPVDGGLVLLAAAGAGYAVRRLGQSADADE